MLLLASACGEGVPSDPGGVPSAIAVTVLVPSGLDTPPETGLAALTTSIEYTVDCLSREAVTSEGTLERTAEFEGAEGRTAVWKGLVELVPGSCTIRLLARDDGGELICYSSESLNIEFDVPSELYLELPCSRYYGCSTTPLPDSARAEKNFCALVGVILSAETPAALEDVQSIRYVMSGPEFGGTHEGSLLFSGPSTADFGGGPVPTDIWDTAIEEVIASQPYILELTALDSQGEPVCAVEKRLDIVPDAVAQIYVAMPCTDGVTSP